MISSGGTGGGSGLLTGMGTGSVAGAAGLIGPASCACTGIILATRSTAIPEDMVVIIERRFIVRSSIRNSLRCNPRPYCSVGSRPRLANSVPQSELDRWCAWRRGKRELNLGRINLGNDDRLSRGPFHRECASASSLDFKPRDFCGNCDLAARRHKILAMRAGLGLCLGVWR